MDAKPSVTPEVLTKKEIMVRVGLWSTSERRYARLRKLVFTDEVLKQIGITPEEYKGRKSFTLLESVRIKTVLGI